MNFKDKIQELRNVAMKEGYTKRYGWTSIVGFLFGAVTAVLLFLKVTKVLDISYWLVVLPILVGIVVIVIGTLVVSSREGRYDD